MSFVSSKSNLAAKIVIVMLAVALTAWLTSLIAPGLVAKSVDRRIASWQELYDDGVAHMSRQEYGKAESFFLSAASYAEQKLSLQPFRLEKSVYGLGGVQLLQGRFAEAGKNFEHALRINEQIDGETSTTLCPVLGRLVQVTLETGDLDSALYYARRSASLMAKENPGSPSEMIAVLEDLARVYETRKEYADAVLVRAQVVQIMEKQQHALCHDLGVAYFREAMMHHLAGTMEQAETRYADSLRFLEPLPDRDATMFNHLLTSYRQLLRETGRQAEATRLGHQVP